jgi:hypoxanthine phosphoribosyltransferase
MGAIASGGARVLNRGIIQALQIDEASVDRIAQIEEREIRRREALYRGAAAAPVDVKNRTVVVVDDGLATGSTMRAAVAALRSLDARRIVVAVPVAAPETCAEMANEADEVVCATTPEPFQAVGLWYEDFSQTSDEEVIELLDAARRRIIRSVIPPERWSEFAESYGAEHRAWLADISVAEPDGRERVVVHARPLEEIRLTGDAVRIALAGGDSWVAERPSTMAALDDAEGRHVGLAVDSRDGRRVVLAFRSPARPEMLDGYVPARG